LSAGTFSDGSVSAFDFITQELAAAWIERIEMSATTPTSSIEPRFPRWQHRGLDVTAV
jgi:hypothetical protein